MNLNHLGLGVTEVPNTVAMFEKYFGLRAVEGFRANDKMGFLNDDSGALITIFPGAGRELPQNLSHRFYAGHRGAGETLCMKG